MKTHGVELQIIGFSKTALVRHLRGLLKLLEIRRGSWTITLVDDARMAALHARTMGDAATTDVLTFDLRDARHGPLDLDTIICLDEARCRAAEHGHALHSEILLYALHSLLHVRGHDDTTPAKARRMHAREDELLEQIGVGPVYHSAKLPGRRLEMQNAKRKTQNAKFKTRNLKLKSPLSSQRFPRRGS